MNVSPSLSDILLESETEVVLVESCRACPSDYKFRLKPNTTVTVICGRPPDSTKYKAVSYLWEITAAVSLKCRKCKATKTIPIRNATKLWRILNFVSGGGETSCNIWLDALSIDQDDEEDKNEQLNIMGDIYRKAETVAVLLPRGDEGAYEILRELAVVSNTIVKTHGGGLESETRIQAIDKLAELSELYLTELNHWISSLHVWRYWKRAWTFQEWAMASELEIACETTSCNEILQNIKNIIIMSASIIGHHKNTEALGSGLTAESLPQIIRVREETGSFLNQVRLHFPIQDALAADNELEGDDLRIQTFVAASSSAIDSGTFVTLSPPGEKPLSTRAMLSLALNAISTSDRNARYDADLVACWASMCNISYGYNKHDNFPVALHKVLAVLRKGGMRIFNFQVNTTGGETDLMFLKYAAAMKQSNNRSGGLMFGSPIFTGRADTLTHLRLCLESRGGLTQLDSNLDVKLLNIENCAINKPVSFTDKDQIMSEFQTLITGKVDGERLQNVISFISELIEEVTPAQRGDHVLFRVSITVNDDPTMAFFSAWAICPSNIKTSTLFLARESLNGTFVLATSTALSSDSIAAEDARIVAYLHMTHQRDGTYLIRSNEEGVVDIVFREPNNPLLDPAWMADLMTGLGEISLLGLDTIDSVDDRMFNVKISLGKRLYTVAAR